MKTGFETVEEFEAEIRKVEEILGSPSMIAYIDMHDDYVGRDLASELNKIRAKIADFHRKVIL